MKVKDFTESFSHTEDIFIRLSNELHFDKLVCHVRVVHINCILTINLIVRTFTSLYNPAE